MFIRSQILFVEKEEIIPFLQTKVSCVAVKNQQMIIYYVYTVADFICSVMDNNQHNTNKSFMRSCNETTNDYILCLHGRRFCLQYFV
jgi:hypothetical protein